jgi:hypothetical protein
MLQSTAQRFGLQSVEGMYVLANDTRSMSDFGTKADYFQFSIWQDQLRQHLDSIDKMHEQQLADLDEQLTKK